jgi:hypothetical protein
MKISTSSFHRAHEKHGKKYGKKYGKNMAKVWQKYGFLEKNRVYKLCIFFTLYTRLNLCNTTNKTRYTHFSLSCLPDKILIF